MAKIAYWLVKLNLLQWAAIRTKLEQLERLRSENTPRCPHDYPYYAFISDPMS